MTGAVVGLGLAGAAVGVAEAALRLFAPQSPVGMFAPDPRLGVRLTPNFRGEQVIGAEIIPLQFNAPSQTGTGRH